MSEYFRGWKRWIGLVTLGSACMLTIVWMWILSTPSPHNRLILLYGNSRNVVLEDTGIIWAAKIPQTILWSSWIIPYWSLVIPLACLSAWLLLSKRHQRQVDESTVSPAE